MPQDNEYLAIKLPYNSYGTYQLTLFDWVQSHAVYNVPREAIDEIKQQLKQGGATHFRIVRGRHGPCIICYRGTRNPNFKDPHPKKKK